MKNPLYCFIAALLLLLFASPGSPNNLPAFITLDKLQEILYPEAIKPYLLDDPEEVLARIDGHGITYGTIASRYKTMLRNWVNLYPEIPLDQLRADQFIMECVQFYITKHLLLLKCKEVGLYPDGEALTEFFREFRERPGLETEERYEIFLKSHEITEDEAREEVAFQAALRALRTKLAEDFPKPTDEEVQKIYEQHAEHFYTEKQVGYSVLMIKNADTRDETVAKNREWIDSIRKDILDGKKDFEWYARNFSDDATTRKTGGDAGLKAVSKLEPGFDFLLNLKPGELSPVVIRENQFLLFRLNELVEPSKIPFEEVKEGIREGVYSRALINLHWQEVGKMRSAAKIEILYQPGGKEESK